MQESVRQRKSRRWNRQGKLSTEVLTSSSARGAEGGGHGEPLVGTLPLLEGVLDAVSSACARRRRDHFQPGVGGCVGRRRLRAWMGTAFAAARSRWQAPRPVPPSSTQGRPTRSRRLCFDAALGYPWPVEYPERILRNELWQRWSTKESLLLTDPEARAEFAEDRDGGDSKFAHVDAGQGVGYLTESRPASEIVDDLCAGAIALLQQ